MTAGANAPAANAGAAGRVALVAGCSGMVGSRLLPLLLEAPEYARVHALSRRPLATEHARLANRVVRFDAPLDAQLKGLSCHDAFCCLGTTRRAAGSEAAFRAVDHDLVLAFARAALAAGAERFVLVSAVGADAGSRNLYLRVKGRPSGTLSGCSRGRWTSCNPRCCWACGASHATWSSARRSWCGSPVRCCSGAGRAIGPSRPPPWRRRCAQRRAAGGAA